MSSRARARSSSADRPSVRVGGRYRLLRRIGAGAMGEVWAAEDEVLERPVAVKLLSAALVANGRVAARFRREAQMAARLSHPNIAWVYDFGEDETGPFIVMELVEGPTLAGVLRDRGRLSATEAAGIAAETADALSAAHEQGIVHRDVKPGNVMLSGSGAVKVMDFGIADATWFDSLTDAGTVLGTAPYLAPERAAGGAATPASDVYGLGVVLYEMLAGSVPFPGAPAAVALAQINEQPESIARVVPGLPLAVARACEDAMQKDPSRRPPAATLAASLRAAGGPATAESPAATAVLPAWEQGTVEVARAQPVRGGPSSGARWARAVPIGALLLVLLAALALALADPGPLLSPPRPPAASTAPSVEASPSVGPGQADETPGPEDVDHGGQGDHGRGGGDEGHDGEGHGG